MQAYTNAAMRVLTLFKILRSKRDIFRPRNQSAQEGSNSIIFPSVKHKRSTVTFMTKEASNVCVQHSNVAEGKKEGVFCLGIWIFKRFRKDLGIYLQAVQTIASNCIILVGKKALKKCLTACLICVHFF